MSKSQQYRALDLQIKSLYQNIPRLQQDTIHDFYFPVLLRNGTTNLYIHLPDSFPQVAPSLRFGPKINHKYVNKKGEVVDYMPLTQWSVNKNLSLLIKKLVDDLLTSRATVMIPKMTQPNSQPNLQNRTNMMTSKTFTPVSNSQTQNWNKFQQQRTQQQSLFTPLTVPTNFPQLKNLDRERMEELLNNEEQFERFFNTIPQIQKTNKQINETENQIQQLQKMKKEKKLELEKENQIFDQEKEKYNLTKKELNLKMQEESKLIDHSSPSFLIEQLDFLVNEVDESSEDCINKFMNNEINLKTMINDYTSLRELYYIRNQKLKRYEYLQQTKN
ncbi:vacuolar protein sorting-associated protein 37a [Anaeramoeba flamelloides]|uniref:Vacuolar protein sorting-associated protein 37a n=1 Tax=Anaeramoeba flamelloides TaxID=1746091 RepID=A0ABQ8YEW9_9EUKA|nr:vacuolar protein sorting-associated protein 37a [Anaeramoeba flamelloides]